MMDIQLMKKTETPLLGRKRLEYKAVFDGKTPSRDDIRKEIAKQNKVSENTTIIKHIYTKFGQSEAKVIAHIYTDEATAKNVEESHLLKKHFKEAKKEEAKSEE